MSDTLYHHEKPRCTRSGGTEEWRKKGGSKPDLIIFYSEVLILLSFLMRNLREKSAYQRFPDVQIKCTLVLGRHQIDFEPLHGGLELCTDVIRLDQRPQIQEVVRCPVAILQIYPCTKRPISNFAQLHTEGKEIVLRLY